MTRPTHVTTSFHRRRWGGRRASAFSLAELLVVLLIMACLAGMAVPRYAASLNNYGASAAARRIATDLAYAQSIARTTGASQSVTFDLTNNLYQLPGVADPSQPGSTNYSVSLASAPYNASLAALALTAGATSVSQVTFDKYGFPNAGGTITVRAGSAQTTVTLNTTSGKATVP